MPALKNQKKHSPLSLKQTSLHYTVDDSSDEEEVNEKVKTYKIITNLRQLKKEDNVSYLEGSFITHALGIETLYALPVNQLYYRQKEKILGKSGLPSVKKMRQWVEATVLDVIGKVLDIPSQPEVTKKLIQEFHAGFKTDIEETIATLLKYPRSLLRQKRPATEPLPALTRAIAPLQEALSQFIGEIWLKENIQFSPMETLSAEKLAGIPGIKNNFFKEEEALKFLKKEKLLDPKDISKTLTTASEKIPNMQSQIAALRERRPLSFREKAIIKAVSTGSSSDVGEKLKKQRRTIVVASCVDVIEAEKARGKESLLSATKNPRTDNAARVEYALASPDDWNASPLKALHEASPNGFARFSPYTIDRLEAELTGNLSLLPDIFLTSLVSQKKASGIVLERKILPEQYVFDNKNAIDFLANLRLANRSQTRSIRQQQEEQGKKITGEKVSRAWKFAGSPFQAIETQEFTTNASRTDQVVNLGNYNAISKEIADTLALLNNALSQKQAKAIGDADIARWIRELLKGKETFTYSDHTALPLSQGHHKLLSKLCVNLTTLLFGTESARNPASLITQQMMLDLIISGALTWQKALADDEKKTLYGGGDMPMSMGSYSDQDQDGKAQPVLSARLLHCSYKDHMPYPYQYPGNKQTDIGKVEELRKRESDITRKWTDKFAPEAALLADKIKAIRKVRDENWYSK